MAQDMGGKTAMVLVPLLEEGQELAIGSLQAILEQAHLTRDQFNALPSLDGVGDGK